MTMLNDQIQVPRPKNFNSAKNWILFNTSILGTLNSDMFVKNLILNVNQAITESITEAYIMS